MRAILGSLAALALLMVVVVLLIYMGSTWRVSDSGMERQLKNFDAVSLATNALDIENPFGGTTIIMKEKLGANDALLNVFSMFVTAFTFFPVAIIGCLAVIVWTLFTADFVGFVVSTIVAVLMIAIVPLFLFLLWVVMFIQPCTPGYFLTWLVLGFPAAAAGLSFAFGGTAFVIIIIKPI